jgi:hypothetical protein
MKQKNLTGCLLGSFAMGLFILTSLSAHADWVISPVTYSTNSTTTITPTGSSLGAGGFCYNTHTANSIISTSLVNALSVDASASTSASQTATWSGSLLASGLTIHLGASAQGNYQTGATSASTCKSSAHAFCGAYSADAAASTNYPNNYSASIGGLYMLNPNGESGPYGLVMKADCDSYNKGSYSYGEASGDFTGAVD